MTTAEVVRLRKGLTLKAVAKRLPFGERWVRNAELHGLDSYENARRLAGVLGCDPAVYLHPTAYQPESASEAVELLSLKRVRSRCREERKQDGTGKRRVYNKKG